MGREEEGGLRKRLALALFYCSRAQGVRFCAFWPSPGLSYAANVAFMVTPLDFVAGEGESSHPTWAEDRGLLLKQYRPRSSTCPVNLSALNPFALIVYWSGCQIFTLARPVQFRLRAPLTAPSSNGFKTSGCLPENAGSTPAGAAIRRFRPVARISRCQREDDGASPSICSRCFQRSLCSGIPMRQRTTAQNRVSVGSTPTRSTSPATGASPVVDLSG